MRFTILFTPALLLLSGGAVAQSGDIPCDPALTPISGLGSWDYDSSVGTTESGIDAVNNGCNSATPPLPATPSGMQFDRWFLWTAPHSGAFVLDTCATQSTTGTPIVPYDTKIAVYRNAGNGGTASCANMFTDPNLGTPVALFDCGEDDEASNMTLGCLGFATELLLASVVGGQEYWIQCGGWSLIDVGPAVLSINCDGNCPTFPEGCNGDGGNQLGCTDCPCGNNAPQGTVGGCLNSAGTSSQLTATGVATATGSNMTPPLRFEANGIAPLNSCQLTSGNAAAPANAANPCFGLNSGIQSVSLDGLRCVVQQVLRHGVRPSDANGDVGVTTNGWGGTNNFFNYSAFVASSTKYFQVIHRDDMDAVCMTGQNTTQYIEITFQP